MDIQLATALMGERRRFEFLAHSVICDPVGMMADITPAPSSSGAYPFIPHPGSEDEYEHLIGVLQVARIQVHTDGKQPQVIYDSI